MDSHAENSLIFELMILSRNYSSLRRGNWLWLSPGQEIFKTEYKTYIENGNLLLFGSDSKGQSMIVIRRTMSRAREVYTMQDLTLRLAIKRSSEVYEKIKEIWDSVNPSNSDIILREVFKQLNLLIMESLDVQCRPQDLAIDLKLDFGRNVGMVFCEFYDSIFELIDNYWTIKYQSEYLNILQKIKPFIKSIQWAEYLKSNTLKHFERREKQHPWMQTIFKAEDDKRETLCKQWKSNDNLKVARLEPIPKSNRRINSVRHVPMPLPVSHSPSRKPSALRSEPQRFKRSAFDSRSLKAGTFDRGTKGLSLVIKSSSTKMQASASASTKLKPIETPKRYKILRPRNLKRRTEIVENIQFFDEKF